MIFIEILFFVGAATIFYTYIGYGLLLWFWNKLKSFFQKKTLVLYKDSYFPPVTLIVAAYNEQDFIAEKIKNTLALDYPSERFKIIFITDGSTDRTPLIIEKYKEIQLLHEDNRKGKVAAMHRAMAFVQTPYVIFSDANTLLNDKSIINIVRHYQNEEVGGVAGEKKIMQTTQAKVAGAGEGLYWKYESFLKKMDWGFYTVVGAAGELFSIKTDLYEYPGDNILLDDFIISLRVCQKGYRVAYEPEAYAVETASSSLKEEQKRKIRISAGGFQSIIILSDLLNIAKHPKLSFQYISHRLLRWTLCPIFLPILFLSSLLLTIFRRSPLDFFIFSAQILFYLCAIIGWFFSRKKVKSKFFYAVYYFVFINISLYLGFLRFLKGNQSVLWEKAAREQIKKVQPL